MTSLDHPLFKRSLLTVVEQTHRCVEMLTGLLGKFHNFSEASNAIGEEHALYQALEKAALQLTKIRSQVVATGNIQVWPPCDEPADKKRVSLDPRQGCTL